MPSARATGAPSDDDVTGIDPDDVLSNAGREFV